MILRRCSLVAALAFGWLLAPTLTAAPVAATPPRFQDAIDAFQAADRAQPPPQGGILFVGSSIFRQWTTVAEQMAPLPVTNRAFGGSRTQDQLDRFDQVVLPCAPRVIVYYCGSNDLKAGENPEDPTAIFARFRQFSERARAALPGVRIVFVSSNRSLDRVPRWSQVDFYNALARAHCATTPDHTFIDINPALVDATGAPRVALYRDDRLHFNPPAYVEFTALIKPVLTQIWSEVTAPPPPVPRIAPSGSAGSTKSLARSCRPVRGSACTRKCPSHPGPQNGCHSRRSKRWAVSSAAWRRGSSRRTP